MSMFIAHIMQHKICDLIKCIIYFYLLYRMKNTYGKRKSVRPASRNAVGMEEKDEITDCQTHLMPQQDKTIILYTIAI